MGKKQEDNQPQRKDGEEEAPLVTLAKRRFDDLWPIEEEMFRQIAVGKEAVLGKEEGEKKKIRAECINWLCTDKAAKELVTHKGIAIVGAEFEGVIDLQFAEIPFPLQLIGCSHPEVMNFEHAKIRSLLLNGSRVGGIEADGIDVEAEVFMQDGFEAKGGVRLVGARIGGDLDCVKGTFFNEDGYALQCDRMKVEGGVYLRNGFNANGMVRFLGVRIGGSLNCEGGKFYYKKKKGEDTKKGNALICDGMKVEGTVFLRDGFEARGGVRLVGARIG